MSALLKGYKINNEEIITGIYDVVLCKWLNLTLDEVNSLPVETYLKYGNIILPLELNKLGSKL